MFNLFKKKEPINIFYSVDDNYTDYLIVAMTSVILSADKSDIVHFYIMHCIFGIEYDNVVFKETNVKEKFLTDLKQLEILAKNKEINIKIELINVSPELVASYDRLWYITQTAYFRFFITAFKPELDKCLYLDVDTIVLKSLSSLYNINLKNKYAAVVEEGGTTDFKKSQLEWCNTKKYFNSGVMLINLKKWKQENLFNTFIELANCTPFADQPILNAVFKDNVIWLDNKFNYSWWLQEKKFDDIFIVHFLGKEKPWKDDYSEDIFFNLYKNIWNKSPLEKFHINTLNTQKTFYDEISSGSMQKKREE